MFGQTQAGIAAAVVRGYDYEISETENISNTLLPQLNQAETSAAIKAAMRATAYARGSKERLLLRLASWFV